MEYTYTVQVPFQGATRRKLVSMNLSKVEEEVENETVYFIEVFDNIHQKDIGHFASIASLKEALAKERSLSTSNTLPIWDISAQLHELESEPPVRKDPSNPGHYKFYCGDMQWLEVMVEVYRNDPDKVLGFLEFQISKYLSRIGKKDPYAQDARKLRWYAIFLTAYAEAGYKPIKIKDYPELGV